MQETGQRSIIDRISLQDQFQGSFERTKHKFSNYNSGTQNKVNISLERIPNAYLNVADYATSPFGHGQPSQSVVKVHSAKSSNGAIYTKSIFGNHIGIKSLSNTRVDNNK